MHFSTVLISAATLAGLALSTPLDVPASGNANSLNRRQTVPPPFGGKCPDDKGDCCFGIPVMNPTDCSQCSSGQKCCSTAHGDEPSGSDTPDDSCAQYSSD